MSASPNLGFPLSTASFETGCELLATDRTMTSTSTLNSSWRYSTLNAIIKTSTKLEKKPPLNAEAITFLEHLRQELLISYSNHFHMKSTTNSSDGNFPYGDQPNYRNFLL